MGLSPFARTREKYLKEYLLKRFEEHQCEQCVHYHKCCKEDNYKYITKCNLYKDYIKTVSKVVKSMEEEIEEEKNEQINSSN